MDFKIEMNESLRLGRRVWHPGVYRVPEDMDQATASEAVKRGARSTLADHPAARRGRPRKTPPENKIATVNENKTGDSNGGDPDQDSAMLV